MNSMTESVQPEVVEIPETGDSNAEQIEKSLLSSALQRVEQASAKNDALINQLQQNLQNAVNNKIGLQAQKTMLVELLDYMNKTL